MKSEDDATAVILAATGRGELDDALGWISEGRRLTTAVRTDQLLAALARLRQASRVATALRAVSRLALASAVDPSADLLAIDKVVRPTIYRAALDEVARYTATGSMAQITVEAAAFAQDRHPHVIAALGLVAGLSWRDLRDRTAAIGGVALPASPAGPWQHDQVASAFAVIDRIVRGLDAARLAGATPARPVELMYDSGEMTGWDSVARYIENGVPFEILLAQRAVGGAWLSHRQATTSQIPALIADEACAALDAVGLTYQRSTGSGGDTSKAGLRNLLAGEPGQVGVVVLDATGKASMAIAISVARDGGTARKNAGRLRTLPSQFTVPASVLLVGPGWAERGETVELIEAFEGRVFTERTTMDLASVAAALTNREE